MLDTAEFLTPQPPSLRLCPPVKKSAGRLHAQLHPDTPASIRNLYGSLNEKSTELCASLLPLWQGLEEVRSRINEQYKDLKPAPAGVFIATVSNGRRTYARAQHATGIFHGGAHTMGLKREGSPEHREYQRRIDYRNAITWLAEMEEAAKLVLKTALERPDKLGQI